MSISVRCSPVASQYSSMYRLSISSLKSIPFLQEMILYGIVTLSSIKLMPKIRTMNPGTRHHDLHTDQKEELWEIYNDFRSVLNTKGKFALLFVDGFTASRNLCINMWYDKFDIVVYHDCEPNSVDFYEYKFKKELTDNYDHYKVTTPVSWTGFFVKKGILVDADVLRRYIDEYCDATGLQRTDMDIIKQ